MSKLEEAVHQAELTRVGGDFRGAIEQARVKGTLTREEIAGKPDNELHDIMRLWRVWEVSLLSVSQKQIWGKEAARFLREARDVVKLYYYDPHAWEVAKEMKTDAHGNEYQMASEMCRDEGKLHLYTYHLTLEPSQLQLAIESFDEAVNLAQQGTSAYAVATMEREMVEKEQGKPINFKVFTEAYTSAVEMSPQAGGWDRMAAISWWYTRESLLAGNREGVLLGTNNLLKATREGKQNPFKFVANDLARPAMDRVKQLTVGETLEGVPLMDLWNELSESARKLLISSTHFNHIIGGRLPAMQATAGMDKTEFEEALIELKVSGLLEQGKAKGQEFTADREGNSFRMAEKTKRFILSRIVKLKKKEVNEIMSGGLHK